MGIFTAGREISENYLIFLLTDAGTLVYNSMVQGYILRIIGVHLRLLKGGISNAENLSAEEAPQKKGAWLQKENVHI